MNMKNLKEILSETYNHKTWWSYYGCKKVFDIFSPYGCKSFVENFFEKSGKANLFHFLSENNA